jgi:transposase-like protein
VNKTHDYARLEREYVSSRISLRELCRRHGISTHSVVVDQARKRKWAEKREAYQMKESDAFIEKHAARHADRQAEISDKVLDAIDKAITKFRGDMRATRPVRQPDGSITEEPVMRLMPKDVALLIDRLQILFEHPSRITESRDLSIRSELPIDAPNRIVKLTQGRAAPPTSPLPRRRRLDD